MSKVRAMELSQRAQLDAAVQSDVNLGNTRNVSGTPTLFVIPPRPDHPVALGSGAVRAAQAVSRFLAGAALSTMADAAASVATSAARPRRRYLQIILLIARIVLGLLFLYAAYAKLHYAGAWHLRDYHFLFAFGINSYEMLSLENALLLARVLALDGSGARHAPDYRHWPALGRLDHHRAADRFHVRPGARRDS